MMILSTHCKRLSLIVTICLFASSFTGCAVLKRFPHNYMCPPKDRDNCKQACETCDNHEPHLAEAFPPEHSEVMQTAHWEELSTMQEQLDSFAAKDASLQEQLALLDKNAEQQRMESEGRKKEIQALASQLVAIRNEIESQRSLLEQVEAGLTQQQAKHEEVLASVEQQLIEVLREYQ